MQTIFSIYYVKYKQPTLLKWHVGPMVHRRDRFTTGLRNLLEQEIYFLTAMGLANVLNFYLSVKDSSSTLTKKKKGLVNG